MKIVICDDCMEDLVQVERLLQKYEKNANSKFEVETFSDASKVYHKVLQHELADIYILDMIMPQKSGIDIGSLLEKNGKSVVIYITSSNEFALEAYGVHAARYLLKPVSDAVCGEAMDYAVSQIRMNQNVLSQDIRYPVKTKEGLVSVSYSDIVYIENAARALEVHRTDGSSVRSIFIRKSFDEEIKEIAEDRNFIRVHKSFLVNMNYIQSLMSGLCQMEDGRSIPVSKTRAADVKREYLHFVSEQYR